MSDTAALSTLVDQAWQDYLQDRLAPSAAVAAMRARAGSDDLAHGLAASFEGRRQFWLGHQAAYASQVLEARRRLAALSSVPHDAPDAPSPADLRALGMACDDLDSHQLVREQRHEQAAALLTPWLAHLEAPTHPVQKFTVLYRLANAHEHLRQPEIALRHHLEAIQTARDASLRPMLAIALGSLGGYLGSLLDHEGAIEHCREAWDLCADQGQWPAIHVAGINLMMALGNADQHAEAAAMADRLSAWESHFSPHLRWIRSAFYGSIYQRAGRLEEAQHWLDVALPLCADPAHPPTEWVWAQAAVWIDRGRALEARDLLDQHRLHNPEGFEGATFPADACRLHDEAARAHEALGDLAAALHHQRRAAVVRARAHRRAAEAQRLTLTIRLDLARLADQRDQARQESRALAEVNAALARADAAKTRFLAAASHDLRQPLHALTLQSALLERLLTEPQQHALLAEMTACVQALRSMLDSLLDLSRAEAGEAMARPAPLDLRALLLRLASEHQPQAEARGLRLSLRVSGALPSAALSDAQLLETLLRNLLANAMKYTPQGTVLLCARAGRRADGQPLWRLQVRDSGIGIAPEHQQAIFEPFVQLGNPARQRQQGQGLGLAIVQRLAGALGHTLHLRSALGRGSCFELRVPVHGGDITACASPVAALPPLAHGLHLAVVDDDEDNRRALSGWLRSLGCHVTQGEDARTVEALLAGQPPLDAVMADLQLAPSASGDGVAQVHYLRLISGRSLPALIITGDTRPDTVSRLEAAGLPWMAKPVVPRAVHQWLATLWMDPDADQAALC